MRIQIANRYASAQPEVKNFNTSKSSYSPKVRSNVNTDRIAFGRKCAPQTFDLLNEIIELLKTKHRNTIENLKSFYKALEESANIEINPEVLPKIHHIKLPGNFKGNKLTFERTLGGSNLSPEYEIKIGGDKKFRYVVLTPYEGHLDKVSLSGRVKTVTSINNEQEQDLHPYLNAILSQNQPKKVKAQRIKYFQIKS